MYTLKLTQIGNSVGVILPKELLAQLKLDKGDQVSLTEVPYGFALRPLNDKFARTMEAAEVIMRENRDALRMLAK